MAGPKRAVWVVRHYRKDDVNEAATSPFAQTRSGDPFDRAAIGVTAHASSDGRTIVGKSSPHPVPRELRMPVERQTEGLTYADVGVRRSSG
jgi:hypothetical protein